jgi:hypothetical protein
MLEAFRDDKDENDDEKDGAKATTAIDEGATEPKTATAEEQNKQDEGEK